MTETLLELKHVSKCFSLGRNKINRALNDINLKIEKGEILGIVGESGCGKSTLAKVIMGVYPPTSGEVYYRGKVWKSKTHSQRKKFAKHVQMVFQNPYMSLDPYMTVEAIIEENLKIHCKMNKEERKKVVYEWMENMGLAREYGGRYPHEFSGGQRQRIGIARALVVRPEFVVCDEPISALDISVRSQIINLLIELKDSLELTYLFISHDLNIIHHISDRIAVMYAGQIVEIGEAKEVYKNPGHPYTQMLLQAVLIPVPGLERFENGTEIVGEVDDVWESGSGCSFVGRCTKAVDLCRKKNPQLAELSNGHVVACHLIV